MRYAHVHCLFHHSQQRREIVCCRLSNVVDRDRIPVRASLVDFDLEVRASAAFRVPHLLERGSKVCREFLEHRLMQLKLGLLDQDDDGAIGMRKRCITLVSLGCVSCLALAFTLVFAIAVILGFVIFLHFVGSLLLQRRILTTCALGGSPVKIKK